MPTGLGRQADQTRPLVADVQDVAVPGEPDHEVGDRIEQGTLAELALAIEPDEQREGDRRRGQPAGGEQEGLDAIRDVQRLDGEARDEHAHEDDPGDEDRDELAAAPGRGHDPAPDDDEARDARQRDADVQPRRLDVDPRGHGTSRIALLMVVPIASATTVTRSRRVSRWPVG